MLKFNRKNTTPATTPYDSTIENLVQSIAFLKNEIKSNPAEAPALQEDLIAAHQSLGELYYAALEHLKLTPEIVVPENVPAGKPAVKNSFATAK